MAITNLFPGFSDGSVMYLLTLACTLAHICLFSWSRWKGYAGWWVYLWPFPLPAAALWRTQLWWVCGASAVYSTTLQEWLKTNKKSAESKSARGWQKTSLRLWYSLGTLNRSGRSGTWSKQRGKGDNAEWRQLERQATLQPVRQLVDQSDCGLWYANQEEMRIAGATDVGMRNRSICYQWLPDDLHKVTPRRRSKRRHNDALLGKSRRSQPKHERRWSCRRGLLSFSGIVALTDGQDDKAWESLAGNLALLVLV